MSLVDEKIFEIIAQHNRKRLTLRQISDQVGCHLNTAYNSASRLEQAGRIKRLRGRGRGGMIYEVVNADA